ncbi:hypothetical protein DD238_003416 [Peronospora effusa]|uniref:PUB domain-containing protein n=1 Tax=Peronospora effusa TaxID=542832 RepID=A0A3M6VH73_9STRA|nr:hypothetical protein DD238_003416 [Peronospora effusa]
MDWLKKKKDKAKQAAAKISNKRTTFQGEGNVLGGTSEDSSPPSLAAASRGPSIKVPLVKLPFTSNKPRALSEEEQQKRRELQAKALEQRGNAWDKRVATARKARMQQEGEEERKFQYMEPTAAKPSSVEPPVVLSNEAVKARELQSAQTQMGFNPYAATFSSSTQAVSAMHAIGNDSNAPPSATGHITPSPFGEIPHVAAPGTVLTSSDAGENAAVYVLLRQDPSRAITAAETLIKMLSNVIKNPQQCLIHAIVPRQDEKFRKIRLANAVIQSKLVAVSGTIDVLLEAGFSRVTLDGDAYLMLAIDAFRAERVQSAIDRVEVALIQLQHDFA